MWNRCRLIAGISCMMALLGCAATQSYRLPLDAHLARLTFAPLVSVAQSMGLQCAEFPDSINVRYDETTWIQYMIQNSQFNMVIVVDDKVVPQEKLQAQFADAKTKGDEIWAKAIDAAREVNGAVFAPPWRTPAEEHDRN